MNPRANIIVFGLWDGLAGGRSKHKKHSHGKTMGYLFNDLVNYLKNSDIGTDVDIKFVDLMVDNMDDYYRTVKMIYDEGYKLPYVMINDRFMFYGWIPKDEIYNITKHYLEIGYIYDEH